MRSTRKRGPRGDTKGFLFQADDTSRILLCRDVRGFPAALEAAQSRGRAHPGRLLLVVPNNELEDWLARWADDVGRVRRTITVTRRTDGAAFQFVGTLLSYGSGVETALAIERLKQSEVKPAVQQRGDESAAKAENDGLALRMKPGLLRRRRKSA